MMSADSLFHCLMMPNGSKFQNGLLGQFSKKKEQIEYRPHTHQVAGHGVHSGKMKYAMLQGEPGIVLKALQDQDRGETELTFYRTVMDDCQLGKLRSFIPSFYGVIQHGSLFYLELSDLTYEFREPCIVDIKIGAILYGPDKMAAAFETIEKKYPLARHIGYQILGMKTYCSAKRSYLFHDKLYFRENLNLDNVLDLGIGSFFQCCSSSSRNRIVEAILNKLESILAWFSTQKSFVFYSSSLLIMYEGSTSDVCSIHNAEDSDDDDVTRNGGDVITPSPHVDVRMIDFTHVFPSTVLDDNYLYGLRSLTSHFRSFLKE